MKMFNFTGWKDIFYFTFIQTIKNKSYKVTLVILCILAAAAMPVASLIGSSDDDEADIVVESVEIEDDVTDNELMAGEDESQKTDINEIDTLYLSYDQSDKSLSEVMEEWQAAYRCEYVKADATVVDEKRKEINNDNTYGILSVNNYEGLYSIDILLGWETMERTTSIDSALDNLGARLQELQVKMIAPETEFQEDAPAVGGYIGESDHKYSKSLNIINYMIQLGYIMIFIFVLSFSGESIASSVVSEKAGKMVEFLMITVKPMAILIGKIFAVLLSVIIMFFAMLISAVSSALICNIINDNMVSDYLSTVTGALAESQNAIIINPATILILLLFVIGGLLFYGLIASLCGAAVSKIEELSEGIVMFTFILMIGAYMSIGIAMKAFSGNYTGELGAYEIFTYMLPISSPFSVPQNLITGYVDYGTALISLGILYLMVFLMMIFASKVYEYMLFYNGAKLKLKDIIHIARHGKIKEAK